MTAQEITNKVEHFKAYTEKLMEENPELKEMQWEIKNVPYKIFNEFRKSIKGGEVNKEEIPCGGMVYCRPVFGYGTGCSVNVWSVPVKIKTHVEVIEEKEELVY